MKSCKLLFWLILLTLPLAAQIHKSAVKPEPLSAKSSKLRGTITVRVLSDDGQLLDDVDVSLSPAFRASKSYVPPEKPTRQKEGSYRFENISAGVYRISAVAPGYVKISNETSDVPPTFYRIGETALITLTRGAVITGTVTDADGTPLIEARVRAIRIRNQHNERTSQTSLNSGFASFGPEFWTNDKGIYRIFGLLPGAYLIVVGSGQGSYFSWQIDSTNGAPTYYPSDPIDTATEIMVTYGQEVAGIDIRYRNDAGQIISGTISGAVKTNNRYGENVNVTLVRAGSGLPEAIANVREENGKFSFKMEQIPRGEYQIQAVQASDKEIEVASKPAIIKLTDSDLTGLELRLQPLATIVGKVIFAADSTLKKKPECQSKRAFAPEETELRLRRDAAEVSELESYGSGNPERTPDENGDFAFRGLEAGKYRLTSNLPSENLFVRSLKSADGKTDFGKVGLSLGAGGSLNNLVLTISDGAASLKGKVEFAADKQNPKSAADKRFLVDLIPAEKGAADDLMRYAEVVTQTDGNFEFKNLAPGAYFLVPQLFVEDKEKIADFRRLLFWNAAKRAELLRAAAQNNRFELAPCQNLTVPLIIFNK